MKYLLSICIPTYNRKKFLEYSLEKLITFRNKYEFEICVSDNASDDGTDEYMKAISQKYKFIRYYRQEVNKGGFFNWDFVLNMGKGKYKWLLGSDDEILEEGLYRLIEYIKKNDNVDLYIMSNIKNSLFNIHKDKLYMNKNNVIEELAYGMTWMSTLIFSENFLERVSIYKYKYNSFPHLLAVFHNLNSNCLVYYISAPGISIQSNADEEYKMKYVLKCFLNDVALMLVELTGYDWTSKRRFLKKIINTNLSTKNLLSLRMKGYLEMEQLKQFQTALNEYPLPFKIKIYLISLISKNIIKKAYIIYRYIKYN